MSDPFYVASINTDNGRNYIDIRYKGLGGGREDGLTLYFARFRFDRLHPEEEGIGSGKAEAVADLYRVRRDLMLNAHVYAGQRRPLSPHEREVLCQLIDLTTSRTEHITQPPASIGTLREIREVIATTDLDVM